MAVDGQALIEQCLPNPCGTGADPNETFKNTPIDWFWQRCDTERFVSVEVKIHPTWDDFPAAKRGRIIQSVRSDLVADNLFNTAAPSTKAHQIAQHQDPAQGGAGAKTLVTVSAHVRPYDYVAGQKLQFAVSPTHDISPYRIGNKREMFGAPAFSASAAPIVAAQGYGTNVGIAEVELDLAGAKGGDQFRILTADSGGSLCGIGDVLSVWRRMYVEADPMYTLGTYVTTGRTLNPGGGPVGIPVHDSTGATVDSDIVIFSPEGAQINAKIASVADGVIGVKNYQVQQATPIGVFWGVRPSGNVSSTDVGVGGELDKSRSKAFGGAGNFGEDGGGFIEFVNVPAGTAPVPYSIGGGPSYPAAQDEMASLADRWFAARVRKDNVMHLVCGLRLTDTDSKYPEPGGFTTLPGDQSNNCYLFLDAGFLEGNNIKRAQAATHETGHIFGVVNPKDPGDGKFPWVDTSGAKPKLAHDPETIDIMDYTSDLGDDMVEFSTDVLFHLRKRENPDK